MSYNFSITTKPKARKDYHCCAWEWLADCDWSEFDQLTFSERKAIVRAKRNNFMIKRGDIYTKTTGKYEGEFVVFRAIPELNAICKKYDIYDN